MSGFMSYIDEVELTIAALRKVARCFPVKLVECMQSTPHPHTGTFIRPSCMSELLRQCTEGMLCFNLMVPLYWTY